jgi:polyhydroxybutyrate depolymerase
MKRGALAVMLLGCHGTSAGPQADASALVAARPYDVDVPPGYDPARPAPLLLALHGYGDDRSSLAPARWGLSAAASARGFLLARASGTLDSSGARFWNATDACCDFEKKGVDDVAYLTAVVDDVATRYRVDPKRIWVVGLSNGGYMTHRLACDRSERFAAVVSIAGATWKDATRCPDGAPVSLLEVHATDDPVVGYDGGASLLGKRGAYPSVLETVAASATKDRCAGALATFEERRPGFDTALPGEATRVSRWTGCPAGIDVELWTMPGSRHVPQFTATFGTEVIAWLERHPRP